MDKIMTSGDQQNVSISINGQSRVPPGFRFHPTEEELLQYYLRKKVAAQKIDLDVIVEVDLNKLEPWDIQEKCKIGSTPQNDWYFFSHKDKKYPTGTRTNRATMAGFWKATGRDKVIYGSGKRIGMRKTLVFYKGRAPHGQKSDWIMHEYRLIEDYRSTTTEANIIAAGENSAQEEGWVVCKIFKKKHFPHKLSASGSTAGGGGRIMTSRSSPNCSTMMTNSDHLTESYLSSDHEIDHRGALEQIFQHIGKQQPPSVQVPKYANGIITTTMEGDDQDDEVVFNNNNNRDDNNNDDEEEDDNHGIGSGGLSKKSTTSFDDNFTAMKLPSLESPPNGNTTTNVAAGFGYNDNTMNHMNVDLTGCGSEIGKDHHFQVSYTTPAAATDELSDWGTIDQLLANNLIGNHHHNFNQQKHHHQQQQPSLHHHLLHNMSDHHHDNLGGFSTTTTTSSAIAALDDHHHHHLQPLSTNMVRSSSFSSSSTTSSTAYFLHHHHQQPDSFLNNGGGVSEIDHLWNLVSRSNPLMAPATSGSDLLM